MGASKPWTTDLVLQRYRFCNIRRQDDEVTMWLKLNWYPKWEHPNFIGAITLARLFNRPHTLDYAGFPENWDASKAKLLRDMGATVFNPAYIVSTAGRSMDKIDYVYEVAAAANEVRAMHTDTLNSFWARLTNVKGLGGGFLAAQVVADVKYTPLLAEAADWHTWCVQGPGSLRGMNRLCDLPLSTSWANDIFMHEVGRIRNQVREQVYEDLHAQDVQNCLCEFDKWMRAREGGRPKQYYPGTK
jgi:alpha-glutamyl/putrescinyl thymine pyrophosphorylase clade 1